VAEGVIRLEGELREAAARLPLRTQGRDELLSLLPSLSSLVDSAKTRYDKNARDAGVSGGNGFGGSGGDPVSQGLEGLQRMLKEQAAEVGTLRAQAVEKDTVIMQVRDLQIIMFQSFCFLF
jgi:hypothetical protein